MKRRLFSKYQLLEDVNIDVSELERADVELGECERCTGEPCQKRSGDEYIQPVVINHDDIWEVIPVLCKFGRLRQVRKECGKAFVPLKYAGKTFTDYEITGDNERAVGMAYLFAKEKPERGLYMYGGVGTGKTFLASLTAREYLLAFKSVIFGDVPSLLEEIKQTFNGNGDTQGILDRYCECDLLVLDDLGAGQVTDWNIGQIYQIVNRRYNANKAVIVTSNYDFRGLEQVFASKDETTAARIISRLKEMTISVFLGTNDRRK